jgi:hypothetical protein
MNTDDARLWRLRATVSRLCRRNGLPQNSRP